MSSAELENLSALVDGELGSDQVRFMLRRTGDNPALRATWSRYHVIRDGIRREVHVLAATGFVERVMHEIETDATASGQGTNGRPHRWLRWSAGGAIAAGVAAVALIVVQPQMHQAPAAVPADVGAVAQAAAPVTPPAAAPMVPRWLSAAPSAAGLAQPAAADFYSGPIGEVVPLRGYAQPLAPYMTLPAYRTATARDARQVMYKLWTVDPHQASLPPPRTPSR